MAKQSSNLSIVPVDPTYRNKVLAITGFAGLAFGIVAGLMLVRNIEFHFLAEPGCFTI